MAQFEITPENLTKIVAGHSFTIHAMGPAQTMNGCYGPYEYRSEIRQQTYGSGWPLSEAMEDFTKMMPDAELYKVIVHDGEGGCVSGWERDAMPGF